MGDGALDSAAFLKPQSFHIVGTVNNSNETRTFVVPDTTIGEGDETTTTSESGSGSGSGELSTTAAGQTTQGTYNMTSPLDTIVVEVILEGRFDFEEDATEAENIEIAEVRDISVYLYILPFPFLFVCNNGVLVQGLFEMC